MRVTNNHTTGRLSQCTACHQVIEEALLMQGLRQRVGERPDGAPIYQRSHGVPVWRTPDRGPACTVCPEATDGTTRWHTPGRITRTRAT